jgi:hypothetical protein
MVVLDGLAVKGWRVGRWDGQHYCYYYYISLLLEVECEGLRVGSWDGQPYYYYHYYYYYYYYYSSLLL